MKYVTISTRSIRLAGMPAANTKLAKYADMLSDSDWLTYLGQIKANARLIVFHIAVNGSVTLAESVSVVVVA